MVATPPDTYTLSSLDYNQHGFARNGAGLDRNMNIEYLRKGYEMVVRLR